MSELKNQKYFNTLEVLKDEIRQARTRAHLAINKELTLLENWKGNTTEKTRAWLGLERY
jgi:hypothetical protein